MAPDDKNLIAEVNQIFIVEQSITYCMEGWRHLDEPHERLRWARKNRGYEHARDAARAMGVPPATYGHHENGTAGFSHSAVDYADFFRVNLIWLLTGRGSPRGEKGDNFPPSPAERIFNDLSREDQARWLEFGRNLLDSGRKK